MFLAEAVKCYLIRSEPDHSYYAFIHITLEAKEHIFYVLCHCWTQLLPLDYIVTFCLFKFILISCIRLNH